MKTRNTNFTNKPADLAKPKRTYSKIPSNDEPTPKKAKVAPKSLAPKPAEHGAKEPLVTDREHTFVEALYQSQSNIDIVRKFTAFQAFILENDWDTIFLGTGGDTLKFEEPQTSQLNSICEEAQNTILSSSELRHDPSVLQKVDDILKTAKGKCPSNYNSGFLRINPDLFDLIPAGQFAGEFSEEVLMVRQATIDTFEDFQRKSQAGPFTFLLTGNPGIG